MVEARCDYTVEKRPGFYLDHKGERQELATSALIRTDTGALLDEVGNDWEPIQNKQAFEFFCDFVAKGDMDIETAGALHGGRTVFVLAKTKLAFSIFKGDETKAYMLFANPHKYATSATIARTGVRVVCNNTINLALKTTAKDHMIRITHRNEFDPDAVKIQMGITKAQLMDYKKAAEFLGSKKAKDEDIVTYLKRIFPNQYTKAKDGAISKNAKAAQELISTQPGAKFAEGTWWPVLNAVTHLCDHVLGASQDQRVYNSWYGSTRKTKLQAFELGMEMANAS